MHIESFLGSLLNSNRLVVGILLFLSDIQYLEFATSRGPFPFHHHVFSFGAFSA